MSQNEPFVPKKSLGQNFLISPGIVHRIISSCDLEPTDIVLEIGPGKGALTRHLSEHVESVIAIEKDAQLAEQLKKDFENTNVRVIHADILEYPFTKLPNNIKVIGNLPYNIATPIIEKALNNHEKFSAFYMTVQLEYGQRIVACPSSKNHKAYGSFSCFVQYYGDPKILFKISNSAFQPAPKVQSCFLRLSIPKKKKYKVPDESFLFGIIRASFNQRRKTIENSLSSVLGKKKISNILADLKIDPKLRAENISLEEFIRISNAAR